MPPSQYASLDNGLSVFRQTFGLFVVRSLVAVLAYGDVTAAYVSVRAVPADPA